MSLTLVATPIGHKDDITLRAIESLKEADLYIGEERKPLFRLIKELGLPTPLNFELLNEHSTPDEIKHLASLCQNQKVALVTDCGTPGFSDPGAELVKACRKMNIKVFANPGPSSLTYFLSMTGLKLTEFLFSGFLPRETSERLKKLESFNKIKIPIIVMDTPYRLKKTLQECLEVLPQKNYILGMDFTKDSEKFLIGSITDVVKKYDGEKREFLLLIY